ncbi:major head protein [Vibrio phage vB_ValP_VA-RY-3]|nr:major head protein [Vibrio phage vB_ValP_VA-RY-3]
MAKTTYDEPIGTGGNREDLSDIIWDVTPVETPFLTMAGSGGKAKGTSHDWLTDELNAPEKNAAIEGADAGVDTSTNRVRLDNKTQIFTKTAKVSGTQEDVDKAGVKSEMAYQIARRMKEMKRDIEAACVGKFTGANAPQSIKVAGSDTVARRMGGFLTYMTADTWVDASTGGTPAAPTGNGQKLPTLGGTMGAFKEEDMVNALQKMWEQSGGNENIFALMGAFNRVAFSNFSGTATRYVSTDDARLQASIDVYDGDFHTITAKPDRFSDAGTAYFIDPEYVKMADLRPASTKDLAVNGDSIRKQIVWETTLEVNNPKAHMVLGGLTTSY